MVKESVDLTLSHKLLNGLPLRHPQVVYDSADGFWGEHKEATVDVASLVLGFSLRVDLRIFKTKRTKAGDQLHAG